MKTFEVRVDYKMRGTVTVQAQDDKEAEALVLEDGSLAFASGSSVDITDTEILAITERSARTGS